MSWIYGLWSKYAAKNLMMYRIISPQFNLHALKFSQFQLYETKRVTVSQTIGIVHSQALFIVNSNYNVFVKFIYKLLCYSVKIILGPCRAWAFK